MTIQLKEQTDNYLPKPPIHYSHGHSFQCEGMRLSVHQHLISHEETSHHEENLDDDASVEEEGLEEIVVRLKRERKLGFFVENLGKHLGRLSLSD